MTENQKLWLEDLIEEEIKMAEAYWAAYKNRKGNYKNYLCSACHKVAPMDKQRRSIISNTCPHCNRTMSMVGILPETKIVRI